MNRQKERQSKGQIEVGETKGRTDRNIDKQKKVEPKE